MAAPAPPERRVPGYAIVLALILVAAFVAVFVVLARPGPRLGPPILLVTASDAIRADPGSRTVTADFGPRCSDVEWVDTRDILTIEADIDLVGVEAIFLQKFVPESNNFLTTSRDFVRAVLLRDESGWPLVGPVDGRILEEISRQEENVTFRGLTYGPGLAWTVTFGYEIATGGGPVAITETIQFLNRGIVQSHILPPAPCV